MIISHKYRFIFVRTRKVAGSSLETVLARYLEKTDYATRQSERERAEGRLFPQCDSRIFGGFKKRFRPIFLYGHAPVTAAYDLFRERVGDYTVFSVERNPWDRAVSTFYWANKKTDIRTLPLQEQIAAFRTYVKSVANPGWKRRYLGISAHRDFSQRWLYCIGDVAIPDVMLRFEHIAQDLEKLSARLGLQPPANIDDVRLKSQHRASNARDYTIFYDAQTRHIVADACAWEIEQLKYRFGAPAPEPYIPDPRRMASKQAYLASL